MDMSYEMAAMDLKAKTSEIQFTLMKQGSRIVTVFENIDYFLGKHFALPCLSPF